MIIVRFHGGLGNQMFQYVFYEYMRARYKDLVKADLTWFDRNYKEHQGYELEKVFGIKVKKASYEEIGLLHEWYPRYYPLAPLRYLSRKYVKWKNKRTCGRQPEHHIFDFGPTQYAYNPVFEKLDAQKDWYIEGVFCSDAYYERLYPGIKQSLQFCPAENKEFLQLKAQMQQENSVAIHVRRGDYVGNVFDILGVDYYKRAVEAIKMQVEAPHFYVFSDDMEYIQKEFGFLEDYTPVHNAEGDSFRDMELIASCRHAIIANSSFSYWGAVLGEKEDSKIIAPQRYKKDETISLARKHWILL